MDKPGIDLSRIDHCLQCQTRMKFDQRYCLECGARRGPQPPAIAAIVASIREHSAPRLTTGAAAVEAAQNAPAPARTAAKAGAPAATRWRVPWAQPSGGGPRHPQPAARGFGFEGWTPNPLVASVAVMGMLGLGVIVGDLHGAQSLLETGLSSRSITVNLPAQAQATPAPTTVAQAPATTSAPVTTSPATTPAATTPAQTTTPSSSLPPAGTLPPVKHVFLVVLSDQGFGQTFSVTSSDTYLNKTLPAQGELIDNYYAVAGSSLSNEIAMLTGQGPTEDNESNCEHYKPISPFKQAKYAQIVGKGCIYPKQAGSLPALLAAKHDTYKAYLEGLNDGPKAQLKNCGQPAAGSSEYQVPTKSDPYVAWRNPFAYIGALRSKHSCQTTSVPMTALATDLKQESSTPTLSFIVPGACDNGDSTPCRKGAPAGLGPADKFLKATLKLIEASPAYKDNGLIAITFDHAPQSGPHKDSSALANLPAFPNITSEPGTSTTTTTTATTTTPYSIAPTGSATSPGVTTTPASGTATAPVTTTTPGTSTCTSTSTTTTTTPTSTTPAATTPEATTTPSTTTSTTGTTTGTTTTPCTSTPVEGGLTVPTGGGGNVGLLLISKYVKPGVPDVEDYYNHYSLLGGIEALLKLKKLGYTADTSIPAFGTYLYNASS